MKKVRKSKVKTLYDRKFSRGYISYIESVCGVVEMYHTAKGISYKEIATKSDLALSTVYKMLAYKTSPNMYTLFKVLKGLGKIDLMKPDEIREHVNTRPNLRVVNG